MGMVNNYENKLEPLDEEAKKYKSAEEFIKAQKGTTKLTIKELKIKYRRFCRWRFNLVDDKYLIKVNMENIHILV